MVFNTTSPDEINGAVTEEETRTGQGLSPGTHKHLGVKEFEENSAKEAEQKQPDMLEEIQANVGIWKAMKRGFQGGDSDQPCQDCQ